MWQELLKKLFETSRWRIICALIGLFVGILFIILGFFRAVFLLFCIGLGFYIGYKMDEGEDLADLLDNWLPPYHK
ncbi:MAG: DUF2273 domain-containing protein [Acidaminococcus sp.]|jgi:uncharacterized membrane protein|nr:DUF2273 domain-containing protein [Acidaminococcus sp.]MCI2113758.1 DUF2273 domain-containing protein [Acidaminococcus sp.]MCI2115668.1 DUF2273 domain-containing protein [Acidaminococcus sp.]